MLTRIKVKYGESIGVEVFIPFPDLQSLKKTFLSDDMAAGTSVSVDSGAEYVANDYGIIGLVGVEKSEIVKVSSAVAATITLSSSSVFAHNRGDTFTFIPYDQIKIERSTDGTTYSALATISIRADATETYYLDTTGASTYYYRVKFYNSTSTNSSATSDVVIATGLAYNTVGAIKARALDQMDEKVGGIITDTFLNESLWEARREVDSLRKRWSWRTAFNTDIGNMVEGAYSFASPTTLRNPDSPQNILGLRIGSRGRGISYVDKQQFDSWYEGIIHTTVATQPSVGQTTLVLTSTRDLDDSGSVEVGVDTITYTSKSNSTNTLSGVPASGTGSITVTHAAAVDAWQNVSYGEPTEYTIYENTLFFNVPFNSDFEGDNMFMDFYRTLVDYDSDSDTLDEPQVDMYVAYLKFKIKYKKKKGDIERDTDPDYKDYLTKIGEMTRTETLSQDVRFVPDIGHLISEE